LLGFLAQGYGCESSKVSEGLFAKRFFKSCVFCLNLVNCIEIHKKSEKCETNFASSLVKSATTVVKVVYGMKN
jgi:hypothetical protein